MKFLTREWVTGVLTDNEAEDRYAMYQDYVASIKLRLPEGLRSFVEDFGLIDGLIENIIVDHSMSEIVLLLRCGDRREGYFDAELHYLGVDFGTTDLTSLRAAAENPETEVLYDEVDIDGSVFTHSYLFWPQHETTIRFNWFRYKRQNQPDRLFAIPENPYIERQKHNSSI